LDADLAYVRDMGMNTIRLEGGWTATNFSRRRTGWGFWSCPADMLRRVGALKDWKGDQNRIAAASLRDQITRLRNHPSVFVWLNGSDNPPPADGKMYLDIEKRVAVAQSNRLVGIPNKERIQRASGVKMTGPYEYVPPVYWLGTRKRVAHTATTRDEPGSIPPRNR